MSDLIRTLDSEQPEFAAALESLLAVRASRSRELVESVSELIAHVRRDGDRAILALTRTFDGLAATALSELCVSRDAQKAAFESLDATRRSMLCTAGERIRKFHRATLGARSIEHRDEFGNLMMRELLPLSRVGLYVPGGQASYPSSVLMTAIPARVAGVEQIVVCSPGSPEADDSLVLAAAHIAGVDEFWRLGGVQAIAALAYGCESIERVDMIAGPGSARVTEAKHQVSAHVGIDLTAGPSEVLVVADEYAPADWLALDLCAQAEHDADAQAVLVTPSQRLIEQVAAALKARMPNLERRELITKSLQRHGALIKTRSLQQAIDIANRFAPEHLALCTRDARAWLPKVRHAGAVFLGARSSEVFGDYLVGPSHVLPTSGSARFHSALGVDTFLKARSVIALSAEGASELAAITADFATLEGLEAHAQAAKARRC